MDPNTGLSEPFAPAGLPPRAGKPRENGLTMFMDSGISLPEQRGLLDLFGQHVDAAKILTTTAGLIDGDLLRAKISAYREAGVKPFPGGMFAEYAFSVGTVEAYLDACVEVGFPLVEISQNITDAGPDGRRALVAAARARGLEVLGEVGGKTGHVGAEAMAAEARDFLDAGAWKVLVEAREFIAADGAFDRELWDGLAQRVDASSLWVELPGSWISNVHNYQVYETMVWLVTHVGTEANIANVDSRDVMKLETIRRRIGPNMHGLLSESPAARVRLRR
ncbi:phosphosulfolactate synthase [Microbacterium sp. LWS13-1.2]|uniref:Phosphosulfolactate synthase n=1 Tax=Microbacterium sp. LWS13-1.2 TaxID=3135264 RepID=A0AAU6SEC6_9MICO